MLSALKALHIHFKKINMCKLIWFYLISFLHPKDKDKIKDY